MQVKNYVYISDAKINLFYDQIASSDVRHLFKNLQTSKSVGLRLRHLYHLGRGSCISLVTTSPYTFMVDVPVTHQFLLHGCARLTV